MSMACRCRTKAGGLTASRGVAGGRTVVDGRSLVVLLCLRVDDSDGRARNYFAPTLRVLDGFVQFVPP